MAVTSTSELQVDVDGTRMVLATVLMDSSYAAGGETVTPGDLGLTRITDAIVSPAKNATPLAIVGVWDQTNTKILAFGQDGTTGGLAQMTGDLSAYTFRVLFFGV